MSSRVGPDSPQPSKKVWVLLLQRASTNSRFLLMTWSWGFFRFRGFLMSMTRFRETPKASITRILSKNFIEGVLKKDLVHTLGSTSRRLTVGAELCRGKGEIAPLNAKARNGGGRHQIGLLQWWFRREKERLWRAFSGGIITLHPFLEEVCCPRS